MVTTMKVMKEVKPKIKEYARPTDYIDAVFKKTYDVLKDVAKDKKLMYTGPQTLRRLDNYCRSLNNIEISSYSNQETMPILASIYTPYAYVKVCVNRESDKKGCNTELTVIRKDPKYVEDIKNLDIYNEVEKRLNAGLEGFKHAKVTPLGKRKDDTVLVTTVTTRP